VAGFAKTCICLLNPDTFSDEYFISEEVPTTVTATVGVDAFSPSRGGVDSS
jgi:hypothetical protein